MRGSADTGYTGGGTTNKNKSRPLAPLPRAVRRRGYSGVHMAEYKEVASGMLDGVELACSSKNRRADAQTVLVCKICNSLY